MEGTTNGFLHPESNDTIALLLYQWYCRWIYCLINSYSMITSTVFHPHQILLGTIINQFELENYYSLQKENYDYFIRPSELWLDTNVP